MEKKKFEYIHTTEFYTAIVHSSIYTRNMVISLHTTHHWEKKQTSTRKKKLNDSTYIKFQNPVKLTYDQDSAPTDDDGVKTGGRDTEDTVVLVLTNFIIWMVGYVGGSLCDSLLNTLLFFLLG